MQISSALPPFTLGSMANTRAANTKLHAKPVEHLNTSLYTTFHNSTLCHHLRQIPLLKSYLIFDASLLFHFSHQSTAKSHGTTHHRNTTGWLELLRLWLFNYLFFLLFFIFILLNIFCFSSLLFSTFVRITWLIGLPFSVFCKKNKILPNDFKENVSTLSGLQNVIKN